MSFLLTLLGSTIRVSTPLLFAATGGFFSERSGVINIALEGMMLVGALAGASVAHLTGSPWLGLFAAAFAGMMIAALYGLFVIRLRSDQIVAGTAINFLAAGLTPFFCKILFGVTGSTPGLPLDARFTFEPVAIAWLIVLLTYLWSKRTSSGLWHQFAGEHPSALEAAGIRVKPVRWFGVLMSGFLAGMGGATLSIFLASSFARDMTAGRGFMALAALILGKWKPIPTACACLLFGLADALQIRLQGVTWFGGQTIPVQFIQILPYVVTILVLAGFVGKSRPPKKIGVAFESH